ncbi:hypothetical protein LTR29_007194 [Friedmanniomyces endolithicus]|nr:hypothetical protein LTR29_007194 [Friedmanniomyces endolithicus]
MSGSGIYEDDFEGSDHESLYADSPSDGYFTQRDIPNETFVEQSSVQAESEAKAREAAENQSASSAAAPPSHTSPGSSIRSPVWSDEYTSLRDAGPAPPDYAAATADRNRGPVPGSQRQSVPTTASVNSRPPTSYGTIDRGRSGNGMLSQSPERERPLGLEHPQKGVCAFISFSEATFAIEDSATFALTEAMDSELYTSGGISGSIRLSVAPPEQENDVVVLVSYASTETRSVDDMDHFRALGVFELRFAKNRLPVPCIDVIIGLYIKAHVSLNSLNITTKNLDIQTGQSSSEDSNESAIPTTWAIDHAAFQSHRGSINVAPWSSRETRIVTDSGHISGRYELKDLLYLRTHSGQIEIDIAPQPADKAHPAPAVFDAQSHSGGIRVGVTSSLDIVERDYQTSVQTYSSSIQGTYIFSSSASFDTKSGSIEIDLLPYLDDDALRRAPSVSSSLRTESGSGHTELSLLPPVKHTTSIIKHLQSSHTSASGGLDLVYPQAWEGAIEGATRSGGITLEGKDVKVFYDGETGAGGRRVVARKGYADSKLGFQSQSGSVKLRVGDL